MRRRNLLPAAAAAILLLAAAGGLSAQVWQPTGNMLDPLSGESATVLLDGRVLIAGGAGLPVAGAPTGLQYPTRAEIYDPGTGDFAPAADLNFGRAGQAAVLLRDGRVLIVGGEEWLPSYTAVSPPPEIYDPATGKFTVLQSVNGSPLPVAEFGLTFTATLLKNGKVLITGGPTEDGQPPVSGDFDLSPSRAWLFDPKTNTFSDAGGTGADGGMYSQVLLPDGNVLVVGGTLDDGQTTADAPAQIYHVATNTWETIPTPGLPLGPQVWDPALAVLPNGTVLVAGGGDCCIDQDGLLAWIFDPATETFTPTKGLPRDGISGLGFLLPNGSVFLPASGHPQFYDPATGQFLEAGLGPGSAGGTGAALVQLPDNGGVLSAGGRNAKGVAVSSAFVFHDTPAPFSISAPAAASFPTGFGSVPVKIAAQAGFASPVGLTCSGWPFSHLTSCAVSPSAISPGQTAEMNVSLAVGTQRGYITARSGIYSYWTDIKLEGPDLALGVQPPSQTVTAGATAQYTLQLATWSSFPALLSCSHLPQYAACSFSQNPVVLDATGPRTITLTVTTEQTAPAGQARAPAPPPPGGGGARRLMLLAVFAGLGLAAARGRRIARRWRAAALGLALAAALGCGGQPYVSTVKLPPPPPPPVVQTTPKGAYTVTVAAGYNPGAPLENFNASAQIQLTVQ